MSVIYGTVRGGVVQLPAEAGLAEGSRVEVRPADWPTAEEIEEDRRMQEALVRAGLLTEIKPLDRRSPYPDPPPIIVKGPPISQTIMEERR